MKFDVVVGNPPYRGFKDSLDIHFYILKNILPYSTDKLCFIMPSKPIYVQLPYKYYKMFRDGVCVSVYCCDKSVFKNTNMENTAIFYFNRKSPKSDFCYKFNVNEVFYSLLPPVIRLLVEKMKEMPKLNNYCYQPRRSKNYNFFDENQYYINLYKATGAQVCKWISPTKETPLNYIQEIEFIKNSNKSYTYNIIKVPNKHYGENLVKLLKSNLFIFLLWFQRYYIDILSIYISLLPNLNYNIIDNEKDVLLNCQISEEDADEILKFTNNFNFSLSRNDVIRNEIKLT